jgi:hypothetical protein
MSARKRQPDATRLSRFVRGQRLDRNPLRRGTDRAQTIVLTVLVILLLAGGPFAALAAGSWTHAMAGRTQLAQEASRRQVTAVVVSVAPPSAGDWGLTWQAKARWRAPDGREVTDEIPVPSSTAVGATLPVWTDLSGGFTTAPLLDSQVAGQVVTGEILGVISLAGVLAVAGALILSWINKRRMANWDADWRATGPRWTARA